MVNGVLLLCQIEPLLTAIYQCGAEKKVSFARVSAVLYNVCQDFMFCNIWVCFCCHTSDMRRNLKAVLARLETFKGPAWKIFCLPLPCVCSAYMSFHFFDDEIHPHAITSSYVKQYVWFII